MDRELKLLKRDVFGSVSICRSAIDGTLYTRRDTRGARPWANWLAKRLAAREARALNVLNGQSGTPDLLRWDDGVLDRSWLSGEPLQISRPHDREFYRQALRLVRMLHRRGVTHNDLAKEPNWLVTPDGQPAVVDFQLATVSRGRRRLFRVLAREDLRHLMKLKRGYCPAALTARQRGMLETPAPFSRLWMATGKRLYLLITRVFLGWADREGAEDRLKPKAQGLRPKE